MGTWQRSAELDLARLSGHCQITTVACLLSLAELRSLGLRYYPDMVQSSGFEYISHPIVDMGVPEDPMAAYCFIEELVQRLKNGERILLHCRSGFGRAGMIGACVLLRLGEASSASDALAKIRRLRSPRAVETSRQVAFVETYASSFGMDHTMCTAENQTLPTMSHKWWEQANDMYRLI